MKKLYAISKEELNKFPEEVVKEVMSILKAFQNTNISFENGQYHVSPHTSIKSSYASDHKVLGTVYVEDIYTEEERTQNYIEVFKDYPIWYKGKRDYSIFH